MSETAERREYPKGDPRECMARWAAVKWTCGDGGGDDHTFGLHTGAYCQCAGCEHPMGVCVEHGQGSGCSVCDGPVSECDISAATLHETEPDMYDEQGLYVGHLAEGGTL